MEEKLKIKLEKATDELNEFLVKRDVHGKVLSTEDEKMQSFVMGKMSILIELLEEIVKEKQ